MKTEEIEKMLAENEAKGDAILWNENHWTKKEKWQRSYGRGIIAENNRGDKLKYSPETGVFELANKYMSGIGSSKGEYFTTVEKGLSEDQAFQKWAELVSL